MSHEKTCKVCSVVFHGFTPICKECNLKKAENSLPAVVTLSSPQKFPSLASAPPPPPPSSTMTTTASATAPPPPPFTNTAQANKNPSANPSSSTTSSAFNMNNRGGGGGAKQQGYNSFNNNQSQNRDNKGFSEREASLFKKGTKGRKTQPCRHYPKCKYSDEDCKFIHPGSTNVQRVGGSAGGSGSGIFSGNRNNNSDYQSGSNAFSNNNHHHHHDSSPFGKNSNNPTDSPFQHLYKICKSWKENSKCKYGKHCQFAHEELAPVKRDTAFSSHKVTKDIPRFGLELQKVPTQQQQRGGGGGAPTGGASQSSTSWRGE